MQRWSFSNDRRADFSDKTSKGWIKSPAQRDQIDWMIVGNKTEGASINPNL